MGAEDFESIGHSFKMHPPLTLNKHPMCAKICKHAEYDMAWIPISDKWRNLRKICNSQLLFATKALEANQANCHLQVQELIADVNKSMVKGEAVEIGNYTQFVITYCLFSVALADPNSEMVREYKELVESVAEEASKPCVADYFPVLKRTDQMGIRRHMANPFRKMLHLFDGLIIQRLIQLQRNMKK